MGRDAIERDGWIATGVGLALAVLVFSMPFLSAVFSYFLVLVHEMGHAFCAWLYGYPAIPAFDFVYGGGVTSQQQRIPALALGVQAGWLWLAWVYRNNPLTLALSLGLAAAYALTAWTPLHRPLITGMGHGAELVFAGVFLHRALSGSACHHEAERPLYAFLGFFVVLHDLRFAHRLVSSSFHREIYQQSKGGGHWMDFSVLAEQHLHVSLEAVAGAFLVLCLLPPCLSLVLNWNRSAAAEWLERLLDREPAPCSVPASETREVSPRRRARRVGA